MGRIGIVVGLVGVLVVGLVVGFGVGWAVSGGSDDADLACAAAERLPAELPDTEDGDDPPGIGLLNRVAGVGLLAQGAGQTGDSQGDLDDLGRAGQELSRVLQTLRLEDYSDARDALLRACDDR